MRTAGRCLLVLVLFSATLAIAPTSGLAAKQAGISSVRKVVTNVGEGVKRWPQAAAIALTSLSLLTAVPAVVNAQEVAEAQEAAEVEEVDNAPVLLEAEDIQWQDVVEAHHSATIALESIPVEEDATPKLYTGAYIGDMDNGDALIAGLGLDSIDTDVSYAAYSTDGLLADNLQVEEIAFFNIKMDGFSETSVLVVKGLSLAARYEPLRFAEFPVDAVGEELSMVTYWSDAEEDFPFPIARMRTCEIGSSPNWGKFGIGLTTCSPPSAFRSVLYYGEHGVGFHGGQSRELIFAEGISADFLKFVRGVQGEETLAVDPRQKLPVIWAELKQQR